VVIFCPEDVSITQSGSAPQTLRSQHGIDTPLLLGLFDSGLPVGCPITNVTLINADGTENDRVILSHDPASGFYTALPVTN